MTYEEKRALHLEISQMLADAGMNQGTIKRMVLEEIENKVDRAVNQAIDQLNAETMSGDYVKEKIRKVLTDNLKSNYTFQNILKEELRNKVMSITLKDVVLEKTNSEARNQRADIRGADDE